ncbi:MAG: AsmA family protein, partial [Proteobacteria bacterium]|nr:AsmA family protein [Pseudomonadota bacterium]
MLGLIWKLVTFAVKAGIVVAGIAVVIAYARLSELGDMRKALLSEIGKSFAGRLSIDGPVALDFSFPPKLSIGGVRVRNAAWGSKPDMLKAQQLIAEVDLLPLMRGQMAVPRLRLVGVDIVIEKSKKGGTNWDELQNFETAAGGAPPGGGGFLPGLGNTGVMLSNGTLTVIDQATKSTTTVALPGSCVGIAPAAAGGSGSGSTGGGLAS